MKPFITPDTTTIQAPAGEGCPRCGGKVFAAEQQLSRGTVRILVMIGCISYNIQKISDVA